MEIGKTGLEVIYTERYKACFELYLGHGGRNLLAVEREMRLRGFQDFHRRILYTRKERGTLKPGWIEKFGWRDQLRNADCGLRNEEKRTRHRGPVVAAGPDERNGANSPNRNPQSAFRNPQFEEWLKQVSPDLTWDWPYQKYIYKYLQRVTDGTCKRLMIFMPPRHGKSELVTVRYAGWRLWNDPKMRIIVSSYNQKLADRFSRSIRKLLSEEEDKAALRSVPPAVAGGAPSAAPKKTPPATAGGTDSPAALPLAKKGGTASDARQRQSADYPQCTGGGAMSVPPASAGGAPSAAPDKTPPATAGGTDRMFPRTRTINTASQWETAVGGGVKAVGVGAGVTGFGGQMIVIDDPVKNREQAESETYRERVWDWYRNDLYTRLEPDAAIILIQTRWHQDDLAGRLLQEMQTGGDRWEVIDLPALSEPGAAARHDDKKLPSLIRRGGSGRLLAADGVAEHAADTNGRPDLRDSKAVLPPRLPAEKRGHPPLLIKERSLESADPLGRPAGTALCPERFDENALDEIRRQLGGYAFSALYQQRPTPAEGGIFKRTWFTKFVDRAPNNLKWKRGYDLAVSTKTNSCFTASFRVARDEATGNLYIADGFRERIEYPDQKRFIIDRLTAERDTEHGIEKALHGQALIQDLRRETRVFGRTLRGIDVTADKITRALTWAPLAEEGKVILVRGDWNRAFLDELANFPAGQNDDQIDAVSLAVSMLETKGRKAWSF